MKIISSLPPYVFGDVFRVDESKKVTNNIDIATYNHPTNQPSEPGNSISFETNCNGTCM
jgi:hypothetical protein